MRSRGNGDGIESLPLTIARGGLSIWPSLTELQTTFAERHNLPREIGWSPARRLKAGYFLPAEIYEATVAKHVFDGCAWVDVGGGHDLFPQHPDLAGRLASRCRSVVAIDPDPSVHDNRVATERYQCRLEEYTGDRRFHLATFRMVAEHIEDPGEVVRALRRLLLPGGITIVLTVNRWSPLSVVSRLVPFRLHHPVKRLFWGGDERDTFPVRYRMNTREALRRVFESEEFTETGFAYLDDLSTFGQMKWPNAVELALWSALRSARITYPENCLLGIYTSDAS
jgi:SAM-dependent methyltransferase